MASLSHKLVEEKLFMKGRADMTNAYIASVTIYRRRALSRLLLDRIGAYSCGRDAFQWSSDQSASSIL